ncbi:MAG: hypothetical protein JWM59_2995 [Verrucomicrobiales bacterium]|nr:hypothetical protein [Verrucomicrobiales bacterium]
MISLHRFLIQERRKFGFINESGDCVIPCQFDWVSEFSEGFAAVTIGRRHGLIDIQGNFRPLSMEILQGPVEGLLISQDKSTDKQGVINLDGEIIIPPVYDSVYSFSEGLAVVKKDDLFGAVNNEGKLVIPLRYNILASHRDGVMPASRPDGAGYIDRQEQAIIKFKYLRTYPFSGGRGMIYGFYDNPFGFVNRAGEEVIPPIYAWANDYTEGLASAAVELGKLGFIDMEGNWMIQPIYRRVWPFSNGRAPVTGDPEEMSWGYLSSEGELVIAYEYTEAQPFKNGLALVHGGSPDIYECWSAYINCDGEVVWGLGESFYP